MFAHIVTYNSPTSHALKGTVEHCYITYVIYLPVTTRVYYVQGSTTQYALKGSAEHRHTTYALKHMMMPHRSLQKLPMFQP